MPYFNDAKLFLITIRTGQTSKAAAGLLEKEIRFGILDPADLVQASNLYLRMIAFKQQQLKMQHAAYNIVTSNSVAISDSANIISSTGGGELIVPTTLGNIGSDEDKTETEECFIDASRFK